MLKKILNKITSFLKNEEGQGMVEYIIIVVVIAIAAIVVFKLIGSKVREKGVQIASSIQRL
ncbi:MAG: hypothetical protein ABIK19_04315 [candidate division WOR-3 bacterium]